MSGRKTPVVREKAKAKAKAKNANRRSKQAIVEVARLDDLVQAAKTVRLNAYAPFSGYKVGAALLTKAGTIYQGCNVENSTFGATICAERGAVMQMVAHGETEIVACAVVTRDGGSPCGICRQVLAEFALDMPIVLVGLESADGEVGSVVHLSELLPLAFRLRK